MFPEYRNLITQLKVDNPRFCTLFQRHNQLDHEVRRAEQKPGALYDNDIMQMKKEKLRLKDELYKILKACEAQGLS
ncbi:YdcH family protein [Budvicia aquatica]|uniref:Uncharacterized protein conserved in bacteria n=1 Tax=Budvicia aquatica TaxID=82979 RepID=A0A2C6DMX2_9GAMM|nr:DUF465 domain-containing protein [Budvicia aquatica]PHI30567.1 hypothetical protein CRN84_15075 [Budvicia aquatica]GKX49944.1 hypothetical protein SOASR029_02530 [Budvicia aquatica]VFS49944.1 Uncharacterized protein conserved in bacteria [Budvicia aquatica]